MHNQLLNTNKIISNIFFYFLTPLFICSWFRFFWIPLSHLYSCVSLCSCFVFYYLSGINLAASPFCLFWLVPDESLFFFPPLFHCCLSEKEVQLKCLFDGEIGSVVFVHFFFLNFFFVRLLCESLPVQLSLYPLCFIFFSFCAEML